MGAGTQNEIPSASLSLLRQLVITLRLFLFLPYLAFPFKHKCT